MCGLGVDRRIRVHEPGEWRDEDKLQNRTCAKDGHGQVGCEMKGEMNQCVENEVSIRADEVMEGHGTYLAVQQTSKQRSTRAYDWLVRDGTIPLFST